MAYGSLSDIKEDDEKGDIDKKNGDMIKKNYVNKREKKRSHFCCVKMKMAAKNVTVQRTVLCGTISRC